MRTYTNYDKSKWGDGPWQTEPDKVVWVDEITGLDCMMRRVSTHGAWCGYVGVPSSHPAYGKFYDDVAVEVHGGLTYAAPCEHTEDEATGICHVPESGRTDDIWWLGFDCVHCGDLCPGFREHGIGFTTSQWEQYRDMDYVKKEVLHLAQQLKEQE